jgi:hypothetical protein
LRFPPLAAFADHGVAGNGEPLAIMLRHGGAGSNTAADHIETTRLALAQLPRQLRRKVLFRADSGGGTHGFLQWLTAKSRRLHCGRAAPGAQVDDKSGTRLVDDSHDGPRLRQRPTEVLARVAQREREPWLAVGDRPVEPPVVAPGAQNAGVLLVQCRAVRVPGREQVPCQSSGERGFLS